MYVAIYTVGSDTLHQATSSTHNLIQRFLYNLRLPQKPQTPNPSQVGEANKEK